VHCLLKLECHAKHTLNNILRSNWHVTTHEIVKRRLPITLHLDKAPRWKTKDLHQFQASLHVIYLDLEHLQIKKDIIPGEVFSVFDFPEEQSFVVPVPPRAKAYAVFLKVTGCKDGVPGNGLQSTGMRCVAAGAVAVKHDKLVKRKAVPKKKQLVAKKHITAKKAKGNRKSSK